MKKTVLISILVAVLAALGTWYACSSSDDMSVTVADGNRPEVKVSLQDSTNALPEVTAESLLPAAELSTVEYTVTKEILASDDQTWWKIGDRKIEISCKATLKAGFDIGEFSNGDIKANKSTGDVVITLPEPKLLSLTINPADVKVQEEKIGWLRSRFSAEERRNLLEQGENEIRKNAPKTGILDAAKKNAQKHFEAALRGMGYQHVEVNFK